MICQALWVSSITYMWTAEGFSHLALITVAHSRKIVCSRLFLSIISEYRLFV